MARLQTYQTEDGVRVPEVLQQYMPGKIDFFPFVRESRGLSKGEKGQADKNPKAATKKAAAPAAAAKAPAPAAASSDPALAAIEARPSRARARGAAALAPSPARIRARARARDAPTR